MLTVSAAAERFVAALRARHTPPTTVKAYASDLRLFARALPDQVALHGVLLQLMRLGRPLLALGTREEATEG